MCAFYVQSFIKLTIPLLLLDVNDDGCLAFSEDVVRCWFMANNKKITAVRLKTSDFIKFRQKTIFLPQGWLFIILSVYCHKRNFLDPTHHVWLVLWQAQLLQLKEDNYCLEDQCCSQEKGEKICLSSQKHKICVHTFMHITAGDESTSAELWHF